MAHLQGETPNRLWDDIFKDLERLEAVLRSVPDFQVDEWSDENLGVKPPDLTPDI